MGWKKVDLINDGYSERSGLEGPFRYPSGRVLYYDPKEGRYWDPRTDFYLDHDEAELLKSEIFAKLAGTDMRKFGD
jgi:hypothetical protein